ncbi:type IV secretion system protein VirB10 [Vibrio owensii]|uniref:type IV secretion system protein VirB10 n=1 Tax=Vibrio owensii TaxID=696485 RepID=UPI0022DE4F20|nr:type IV secretion system protein VirB10 [Vibrio owensii]MDA0385581.1 type IV secretion system protein VirB10 [Vibrio owensii]
MDENNVGIPSAGETPNLDRGELMVSGRAKKKNIIAIVALVAIALIVVAIGVTIAVKQFSNTKKETTTTETTTVGQAEVSGVEKGTVGNDAAWFDAVKQQREKEKEQEKRALERARQRQLEEAKANAERNKKTTVPTNNVPTPTVNTSTSNTQRSNQRDKDAPPTPQERRLMAGLMVSGGDKASSSQSSAQPPKAHDTSYDAPTFALGNASRRPPHALDFLLKHGSVIPCALYSQIISDYQGIVMCRVTQDIYSANGKALLVERGSILTGSQNVELEPGKSRVFTTWADIETPNGISIRIDSLGAGRLGASGSEAWVDNHFKERFGGAILLSFIDDAFEALANKTSSSDSDISFDNSTDNATDMAEKALDASINISPTGYTQIGQRINIIVARDIDMSDVYAFQ